jgi:hypothetical protein
LRKCRGILGPSIDTTHTPPLFSFYTTFKQYFLPLFSLKGRKGNEIFLIQFSSCVDSRLENKK